MAFLSVRNPLKGQLDDFLRAAGLRDLQIQDGLLSLIEKMKLYREEGRPLTPHLYIFKDEHAVSIKKLIPYCTEIVLGEVRGPDAKAFEIALKKSAPLAREGWHIFIQASSDRLSYGLFRKQGAFYSVPIENLLVDDTRETELPVVLVRQVAENVVQLKGLRNSKLEVHFSTRAELTTSWHDHQKAMVSAVLKDVDEKVKEPCETFFKKAILEASTHGHGFLLAVVRKGNNIHKDLRDGTLLEVPISIPKKMEMVLKDKSIENYSELQASLTAISGMLNSDGITLLSSNGCILGYNIFISLENRGEKNMVGGARKRTHERLKEMIKRKSLAACFYQSQDGECEFAGVPHV